MQKDRRVSTRRLTELALLIALELVMTYTPLGLLPVGPINASLLTIPVAIVFFIFQKRIMNVGTGAVKE